jgi:hypothetical protein
VVKVHNGILSLLCVANNLCHHLQGLCGVEASAVGKDFLLFRTYLDGMDGYVTNGPFCIIPMPTCPIIYILRSGGAEAEEFPLGWTEELMASRGECLYLLYSIRKCLT